MGVDRPGHRGAVQPDRRLAGLMEQAGPLQNRHDSVPFDTGHRVLCDVAGHVGDDPGQVGDARCPFAPGVPAGDRVVAKDLEPGRDLRLRHDSIVAPGRNSGRARMGPTNGGQQSV
jgi:hypothetical protein